LEATSGKALINGAEVHLNDEWTKKYIAYIPEVVQLYPNLTGIENLDFFSKMAGFNYSKEQLTEFLKSTSLQESAHHKRLSAYSKGMRQKVAIAIAIAKDADVILMDEPTSGLDPKAQQSLPGFVRNLLQGQNHCNGNSRYFQCGKCRHQDRDNEAGITSSYNRC
jgi:ABC-2 type transport system ATP-binding protein